MIVVTVEYIKGSQGFVFHGKSTSFSEVPPTGSETVAISSLGAKRSTFFPLDNATSFNITSQTVKLQRALDVKHVIHILPKLDLGAEHKSQSLAQV